MDGYTDEELSDLTPEELAALKEDISDGNGENGEHANDGDKKDVDKSSNVDPDPDPATGKNVNTDDIANKVDNAENANKETENKVSNNEQQLSRDDGKDPDKVDDTSTTTTQVREPAQVFIAETPPDIDQQLTELKSKKDELSDLFDEGDITAREFNQKLDELNRQERQLERDIDRARLAEDMEKQRKSNAWNDAQADFMAEHPEYDDETRREMFNAVFRTVANRDEFTSLPVTRANSMKLLRAAHEAFVSATGSHSGKSESVETNTVVDTKNKKTELPPTLAGVPAADVNDTNSGRWASLDNLRDKDYEAYENKLFSMSDADREAYLAER